MFSVNALGIGGSITWSMRIENYYIFSHHPPQKPFAEMSRHAPSSVFEEAKENCSPVTDCKWGSTSTSLQTSVSKLAVQSHI